MRRSSLKKTAMLLTLSMLVGSGCSKDRSAETTLGSSEAISDATTTVREYDPVITAACDLFPEEALDYYIPFQDPDRSFCYINEGYSVPSTTQFGGSCWLYSSVNCMTLQYLLDTGEDCNLVPWKIMNVIHPSDMDDSGEGIHHENGWQNVRYRFGGLVVDVFETGSHISFDGYYVVDSEIYTEDLFSERCRPCIDTDAIKAVIRDQGPLVIGISNPNEYLEENNGYLAMSYPDDEVSTHGVVIVGYDDDFPAECFPNEVSSDGAWLCQDSTDLSESNSGYFWLSYESFIELPSSLKISDRYSDVVTYCNCPSNIRFGSAFDTDGRELAFASCYNNEGTIGAVGVYTIDADSTLTVEILEGKFGEELASFDVSYDFPGYHTIELDTPLEVTEFTVVIRTDNEYVFELYFPEDEPFYPNRDNEDSASDPVFANQYYISYPEEGHSFIEINGEWVDLTDREALAEVEEYSQLSDPAINILYI